MVLVHQTHTTLGGLSNFVGLADTLFMEGCINWNFEKLKVSLKERSMIPRMFKWQKQGIKAYVMLKSEVEASRIHDTEMIKSEELLTGFIKDRGMLLECIF